MVGVSDLLLTNLGAKNISANLFCTIFLNSSVAFSWFFRGFFVPLISLEKKKFLGLFRGFLVVFSWLFRGFFVALVLGEFYAYSP